MSKSLKWKSNFTFIRMQRKPDLGQAKAISQAPHLGLLHRLQKLMYLAILVPFQQQAVTEWAL